ncbi:MAG: hypothetical protein DRJ59_08350 [Thermoprotei archaeon]|nr:MAG: hypothetical protein DRJ59_08350 [Thermoprotei archaeon]
MSYVRVNIASWLKLEYCIPYTDELLVVGRPGGGKTRGVVVALKRVVRKGEKVLFLTPLKRHRDIVAEWFSGRFTVLAFMGKQDLCEKAGRGYERGGFLKAVAVCLQCREPCPFKEQVRKAQAYEVVVATHAMAPLFSLPIFQFDYLVVDEADQYYRAFSKLVPTKVVEELEKAGGLGEKIARYVKRIYVRIGNVYVPRVSLPRARRRVLITATAPKSARLLNYILGEWDSEGFCTYFMPYGSRDAVVLYDKILLWEKRDRWLPLLLTVVKEASEIAVSEDKNVGIVSRNYRLTEIISDYLRNEGFRVLDDVNDLHQISRRAEVHVVTVNGRASRGISLPDKDLVIATFQHMGLKKRKLHVKYYLEEAPVDEIARALNFCDNLQAVFRFLRQPDKRHVLLLMDRRLHTSFEETTMRSYLGEVKSRGEFYKCKDVNELLSILSEVLKTTS